MAFDASKKCCLRTFTAGALADAVKRAFLPTEEEHLERRRLSYRLSTRLPDVLGVTTGPRAEIPIPVVRWQIVRPDGGVEDAAEGIAPLLRSIADLRGKRFYATASIGPYPGKASSLLIDGVGPSFEIAASASFRLDAEKIVDNCISDLWLVPLSPSKLDPPKSRSDLSLAPKLFEGLKCFLSYRFPGSPATSDHDITHLREFLDELGVATITAAGFSPVEAPQDKVMRVMRDAEVTIQVVPASGPSPWLSDEAASAKSLNHPLIRIKEHRASVLTGMTANDEWISYSEGHISDAFVKLIQGLKKAWDSRSTKPSPPPS